MKTSTVLRKGFLIISALGALGLSAHNTYSFISGYYGPFVAVVAIMALEGTLIGVTLEMGKANRGFFKFVQKIAYFTSALLVVAMLVATNTLNDVERLGIGISEGTRHLVQFILLNALIPFLAFVNIHAAIQAVDVSGENQYIEPIGKEDRHKELWPLVQKGDELDEYELSKKFGVAPSTIKRDIRSISERIKQQNSGDF